MSKVDWSHAVVVNRVFRSGMNLVLNQLFLNKGEANLGNFYKK